MRRTRRFAGACREVAAVRREFSRAAIACAFARARPSAAKHCGSIAVPTSFSMIESAVGIGSAARYGRSAVKASNTSAVVMMRV